MIGAIFGDIVGSRFEFHNRLDKDFRFLTEECCFTDDTVMTCAVAKALLDCGGDYTGLGETAVKAMQEVGRCYPNAGYGRKFIEWMFTDDPQPYNSCGNGSAMRISAVGFAAESIEQAKELSRAVTEISHNHPEGMKGAEAAAVAIVLARQGKEKREIKKYIEENYGYDLSVSVAEYRANCIGHGKEICQVSVPQAFACFLEGKDYVDVIRNCISIGGDSDTIAAIAGGIAEAFFGVPVELERELKNFLDERLMNIVNEFEAAYPGKRIDYDVFDETRNFKQYTQDVWTCLSTFAYSSWMTVENARVFYNLNKSWMWDDYNEKETPWSCAINMGYTCG